MKKLISIFLTVLMVFSLLSVTAYAESSEIPQSDSASSSDGGLSPIELAISICLMFAGISVIGVMFMKTVMKDKNKLR